MAPNDETLIERYEKYELEDEIEQLKRANQKLESENENLRRINKKVKKENKHFKSTKAYKVWSKYAKIKDHPKDVKNDKKQSDESMNEESEKSLKNDDESKNKKIKNIKDIKVAFIADQFTYDSFKYEFTPISLLPNTWKSQFKNEKPDLFFCESAWRGHDFTGEEGPWHGKIIKYHNNTGSRKILFEILDYCNSNNIPTIFWNKEDPPHYNNEQDSFADTAQHFDYIFTSAKECINRYKEDFNHPNVHLLMFAGQPRLFNPLNLTNETIEEVVFAGSYYNRHEERSRMMDYIFDKILDEWGNIKIFDRFYYKPWADYPKKYEDYINPPIDYSETPNLYKKMEWGLNFNTVTESESMFARRIYELSLTNTNIITNHSKAVEKLFGDNVFVFDRMDKLPDKSGDYEEMRMNNLYNVLENHTYKNRWKQILDTINFPYAEDDDGVSITIKLNDFDELYDINEKFEAISFPNKHLNILISSDIENKQNIELIKEEYPNIEKIYNENDGDYKKQIKKDIADGKFEYWIITDRNLEIDFIKKAILHYQYLNKRVSISSGDDKFKLGVEETIENKLINKVKLNYLDEESPKIDTYYI